jgi:hypothetical protein
MSDIKRTDAMPKEGVVKAFDAGWYAHEVGISRDTVLVITPDSGVGWAVLAWDCRQLLSQENEQA